ncbi:MAG: Hsp20/alpha crystallin family protein [Candidatus Hodarchaeales archaeon]|jgi:HSP20 family molecular chaperone IbpA
MNDKYDNRKEDEIHFNCGFNPFKIYIEGSPGKNHPFFHFGKHFDPFFRKGRRNSFFSSAFVEKDDETYTITFEIPGIKKEDIQLEVTPDELWLEAKNKALNKEYREHLYFKDAVDPNQVKAKLNAGILTLTAPYTVKKVKTKVNID